MQDFGTAQPMPTNIFIKSSHAHHIFTNRFGLVTVAVATSVSCAVGCCSALARKGRALPLIVVDVVRATFWAP